MHTIEPTEKLRVGVKQVSRALKQSEVEKLFIAKDAEQHVTRRIMELAQKQMIPIDYIESMKELGRMCSIDVGAAVAVIIK